MDQWSLPCRQFPTQTPPDLGFYKFQHQSPIEMLSKVHMVAVGSLHGAESSIVVVQPFDNTTRHWSPP
jgi:hypothetical protein